MSVLTRGEIVATTNVFVPDGLDFRFVMSKPPRVFIEVSGDSVDAARQSIQDLVRSFAGALLEAVESVHENAEEGDPS